MSTRTLSSIALGMVSTIAMAQSLVDAPSTNIPIDKIERMKEVVSDKFRDPTSTLFRKIKPDTESGNIICGQVNTKNAYGGYTGYDNFMFDPRNARVVIFDKALSSTDAEREEDLAIFVLAGCAATAGILDDREIERLKKLALKSAATSPSR